MTKVINISRTRGRSFWSFQRFPGGFWCVLNFWPGKLGVHISIYEMESTTDF